VQVVRRWSSQTVRLNSSGSFLLPQNAERSSNLCEKWCSRMNGWVVLKYFGHLKSNFSSFYVVYEPSNWMNLLLYNRVVLGKSYQRNSANFTQSSVRFVGSFGNVQLMLNYSLKLHFYWRCFYYFFIYSVNFPRVKEHFDTVTRIVFIFINRNAFQWNFCLSLS
jgi:hypothetical protein